MSINVEQATSRVRAATRAAATGVARLAWHLVPRPWAAVRTGPATQPAAHPRRAARRPRRSRRQDDSTVVRGTGTTELPAAATQSRDGAPDGPTVGHVHLQVGDLARSAAFYGDIVGFRRTNDTFPGACFLAAGGYHHLGLNTWGVRPSEPQPDPATGLRRFEVVVPGEGALTAAGRRLAAAGHDLPVPAGERVLDPTDPDGIGLRVRVARPAAP